MTLSDDIRAKIAATTHAETIAFGEWVLEQLSRRGKAAAAARTSDDMRRGSSKDYSKLAKRRWRKRSK